jgi:hypothetical protein
LSGRDLSIRSIRCRVEGEGKENVVRRRGEKFKEKGRERSRGVGGTKGVETVGEGQRVKRGRG